MNKSELISHIKDEKSLVEFYNLKPFILEYLEAQENLLVGD